MALPIEVQKFFTEMSSQQGLSEQAKTNIQTFLQTADEDPSVQSYLKKAVTSTSHLSKQMDQLSQREGQLKAQEQELKDWRQGAEKKLSESEQLVIDAMKKLSAAKGKADATGKLDPEDIDPDRIFSKPAPALPSPPPPTPTPGSIDVQALMASIQSGAMSMASLVDIKEEHRRLFGEDIPATVLTQAAVSQGKDIRQVWEETWPVQQKRNELSQKDFNSRVQAEAAKIAEAAIAEKLKGLPQMNPNNPNSNFNPMTMDLSAFNTDQFNQVPESYQGYRMVDPAGDAKILQEAVGDFYNRVANRARA